MTMLNRPFRFCYSVARQELTNQAQMSGSELAAVTMTNLTQMINTIIRLLTYDGESL